MKITLDEGAPSMPLDATLAPHSMPMYEAPITTQCPLRLLHSCGRARCSDNTSTSW